jgi:hypothetical protein
LAKFAEEAFVQISILRWILIHACAIDVLRFISDNRAAKLQAVSEMKLDKL